MITIEICHFNGVNTKKITLPMPDKKLDGLMKEYEGDCWISLKSVEESIHFPFLLSEDYNLKWVNSIYQELSKLTDKEMKSFKNYIDSYGDENEKAVIAALSFAKKSN